MVADTRRASRPQRSSQSSVLVVDGKRWWGAMGGTGDWPDHREGVMSLHHHRGREVSAIPAESPDVTRGDCGHDDGCAPCCRMGRRMGDRSTVSATRLGTVPIQIHHLLFLVSGQCAQVLAQTSLARVRLVDRVYPAYRPGSLTLQSIR